MRSRKYLILLPMLLSLALTPILAQESTPQNKQDLTQGSKLYTEAQVKIAIQEALDKAIPLAVQAAVAQKEGERAVAQSLADQWKAEALKSYKDSVGWKIKGGIGIAAGIAGIVYGLTR
jgi:hypothetical protein